MGDTESSELLWFIVGLVLMLAELLFPRIVMVFFGIGAWATALCAALGIANSLSGQAAVFLSSSIISLVLFRRQATRYFTGTVSGIAGGENTRDNLKSQKAIALSDIVPKAHGGTVEFNGTVWEAESEVRIAKGTTVEIVERKHLVLIVKPGA